MMYPEKTPKTHDPPSTPISHRTWLLGGLSVYSYTDFTIVFADGKGMRGAGMMGAVQYRKS